MSLENVIHCKICKRMFQYVGFGDKICPACKEKDEEDFQRVKTYLRDNPGRTVNQTAEDCDVPTERIRAWLRDERLEFTGTGETGLTCERCGAPIMSGTICDVCRQTLNKVAGEMQRSVDHKVDKPVVKDKMKDKMFILGKR